MQYGKEKLPYSMPHIAPLISAPYLGLNIHTEAGLDKLGRLSFFSLIFSARGFRRINQFGRGYVNLIRQSTAVKTCPRPGHD